MKLLLEIFGDLLVITFGGFYLWHLSLIVRYGSFVVMEGNRGLLWIEVGMGILVILLGIERLIDDIRRQ